MQNQHLIIYDSMMDIFEDFGVDEDYELGYAYMQAIFHYYRTGEEYNGAFKEIKRQMKNIYPLINVQNQNYLDRVEKVISNEEFIALAQSGRFSTQAELAQYITEQYGNYSQSMVSKRLRNLNMKLIKPGMKAVKEQSLQAENVKDDNGNGEFSKQLEETVANGGSVSMMLV